MNKRDLLLEIGIEEMPARFISGAMDDLNNKLVSWLKDHRIGHEEVRIYSTPRRMAILIENVEEFQSDMEEEAKGPAKKIALDEEEIGQRLHLVLPWTSGKSG
ncbi:glycine--tRNA ligase subunit beta [Bacillus sp. N9]